MKDTISVDASGRLVLPKAIRSLLNLRGGARLRAAVVAGHIELVPVAADEGAIVNKGGIAVLKRSGKTADAGAAVAAERVAQEGRGLRR